MCIDNASHTSALANMTLGEFGNAKYTGESYVVSVINHKIVGVSGPAETSKYLQFKFSLEGVGVEEENTFFISYSRKKMPWSMVTVQLNFYWSKADGHTDPRPRFHANLGRKSAVTKRHNVRPNLENDLANLLEDKHKNAVATSQQLTYVLKDREKEREREWPGRPSQCITMRVCRGNCRW